MNVVWDKDVAVNVLATDPYANIDAVAFNIDLIAKKKPTKAAAILDLYKEVKDITQDTPAQPDEDFGLASDLIGKTMRDLDK